MHFFYRILDIPFVYRLTQSLLAPGAYHYLNSRIKNIFGTLPYASKILDIGCGPKSFLWNAGLNPIGLDLSPSYAIAYKEGGNCVVGSSDNLPFADNSFQGIFSIGLLHHLPNKVAKKTITEMQRISSGYIIILDSVFPIRPWRRPIAYFMRRMDRGKYVRYQDDLLSLLPKQSEWIIDRFTYSLFGYELIECTSHSSIVDTSLQK